MSNNALHIRDLSYRYGERHALNKLNLDIAEGVFFGLLGPNGAGKTTLMSLLTRLLKPASGEISVFDYSLNKHANEAMRHIGVVFQQSTLDLDLSVAQNLEYHGALHGIAPREVRSRIQQELTRFALSDRQHDRVRDLNGGHRRRVELARALLHRPKLLLLDEASAGLDIDTRANLNSHVRALCKQDGIAALWTTHLIEELHNEDQILILHKGQCLAQGQAQTLQNNHNVKDLPALFSQLTRPAA
ncbi:ATP-binding cassette domain-containing protein [Zhongshania aliphaticivorans]|jgi:ABC-2 type transport system ATP-binding protein|uniref:ATP-binding cassette domain-containing protein n=1 Tax=Zhongshania aliphaticivorans TaxID=1470434 RepID=UPI0012E43332|nr:ATP-binding cassette domain-containing protein [Zhongshania aliphaticivorans]MBQ0760617.1 ATP-binding cassette domain-containing protein [Zhongshania sp.]CAA0115995.1 ABC transporter ATP-binding protein NatA [Zhongshania aliphaticivorans]